MTELCIETLDEVADLERRIVASADELRSFVLSHSGNGLLLFQQLKFDRVGKHPVDGHPLNAIEQLNQTWTYLVALAATRNPQAADAPSKCGWIQTRTGRQCLPAARYHER